MKKGRQIIAGIVFCVMFFSLAMTSIDVFAAYSSDWKSWTQSGSSNSNVKEYGCRVVAFAKIIYESGWADFSNPDEYFNTGVQNGWFQAGVTENGTFGNALSSYISSRGGTCSLIREISLNQNATSYTNDIMDYVRNGYYITLSLGGDKLHTAYISPSASVAAGKPVVYDSGKSTSTSLIHDLSNKANTGGYWTKLRVWQIPAGGTSGSSDTMMPSIQNAKVVERYKNGFKMQCFVSDNVGVAKVQFPTWESSKTSEGCTWYNGTHVGNGIWEFTFPSATTEGYYTTHIYAWDAAGNSACAGIDTYVDQTQPSISDVRVTDLTADGYKVSCTVKDNYAIDRVQFPTWTSNNGQDDILSDWGTNVAAKGTDCGNGVYEFYVKRSDHNGEFGNYETHVYAYDTWGNFTSVGTGLINLENVPPIFSDVAIINQTEEGYTVTCRATDASGIGKIDVCVWTKENGQDDIVVGNGKHEGNDLYTCYVKYSDHNNEYGEYITHVYAYDTLGNQVFCGGFNIEHKESSSGTVDDPTDPTTPETPTDPTTPEDPTNPTTPTTPSVPSAPGSTEGTTDQNMPSDVVVNNQDNDNIDAPPAVGTVVTYLGLNYKVIKNGKGCYMQCIGPVDKNVTKATVKSYISVGKYKYPVCQIKSNAFKNCKKLKKIVIGKNMKTIGKNVFYDCKKLESITIQSKKLAVVKSKAFKGVHNKVKIKVPKSKMEKYKKLLKKAGVKSTATFK